VHEFNSLGHLILIISDRERERERELGNELQALVLTSAVIYRGAGEVVSRRTYL
jgi:hypothetical protein